MRRALLSALCILCLCILWGTALAAAAESADAERDEAERLSRSAKLEDLERAAALYEERLADAPDSFEARLGAARALTLQMAKRTNGNLPLFDGLQDSDANRAVWSELAPRALEHARRAHALRPDSAEGAAVLANAYASYASSLGIVRSILQGAGGEFREHATRLTRLDPEYENGLGDYLLASFYLVAPWPVGDRKASRSHYERAAELAPQSVRNQYGLGVYWAREDDTPRARRHFERTLEMPCTEGSEQLLCDFMKRESRRALESLGES